MPFHNMHSKYILPAYRNLLPAQEYMDYSSFSRSELIDQLEYEGFTSEQAEYGVKAVGY